LHRTVEVGKRAKSAENVPFLPVRLTVFKEVTAHSAGMGGPIPSKAPARMRAESDALTPAREEARVPVVARSSAPLADPAAFPDTLLDTAPETNDDRRSGQRRSVAEVRNPGAPGSLGRANSSMRRTYVLPSMMRWLAIATALSFVVAALVAWNWPTIPVIACAAGATALAYASNYAVQWERAQTREYHVAFMLGAVLVAGVAAMIGSGFGHWVYLGGLDIRVAMAAIVSLNAVFATVLGRRVALMFTSQVACWMPIVILDGNPYAFAGLGLAAIVVAAISSYQARLNRAREERVEADARERDRAQSILSDYEETGQGWFWETDRRGNLAYVSKSVARTVGRCESELIGKNFTALFDHSEGERTLAFHLSARSSFQELIVRAAVPEEERWWSVNGRPVYDGFNNFCGFRGSGTDLTEKKRSQEDATRLAQYDSLTGLANRLQMSQTLEKILSSPHERERECSVFLLDLDRFKNVNDTLGHPAGDALLVQVSQRLERTVGQMGRCGRLGGDEFQVIVPGRTPSDRLVNLADSIIHALSQPYSVEGHRVVIGASVGIAMAPANGVTSESVIRNADLALYAAKDGGRGRHHFYSSDLHSRAEERNRLEQDLRDAIASGGLELFYQPVVDARSEQITGFEALLRWQHPVHGWLSPAKFIPVAEDSGLITAIGDWALRTACHDLAAWPSTVRCAVNVSPLQFANPQFAAVVAQSLAQSGVDPSRLELEITENVFLNDDAGTDAMFAALKRIGVRLALDDFGTGYSSLGYLKRAPFDKIKIDQSFVRGATQPGSRNGAIIASITSLAHALDMDITAEGCETLDELELVRRYGCTHIQGFVYSGPLSSKAAGELLSGGLQIAATGPRSARPKRFTILRRVALEHDGHFYSATIRNLSAKGALVEGLWNVPPGTTFRIALSESSVVEATSRWGEQNRVGIEFAQPLDTEDDGSISLLARERLSFAGGPDQAQAKG
jgi:diguanylate cyclase (GGDEF)-like protein/PAS domain S-box-containing protein